MIKYLVFPTNREAAIRAAYLAQNIRDGSNPDEAEKIGTLQIEGPGGQDRAIVGSSRISAGDVTALIAGNAPWLEIVDDWPADWVYLVPPA